jgi:hypothetical protein
MRKKTINIQFLSLFLLAFTSGEILEAGITPCFAQEVEQAGQPPKNGSAANSEKDNKKESYKAGDHTSPLLIINGTFKSVTFTVNGRDLQADQPINITATGGFSVSPSTIPAKSQNATVTVTLDSYKNETEGKIILRSGDIRSYVDLKGFGTPLPTKDISRSPVYPGGEEAQFVKTAGEGFKPTNKGYTLEFTVNTDAAGKEFYPYAVDGKGVGFKAYVTSAGTGLYSAASEKAISNPVNSIDAGLGKFYNDDHRSHVYRYAVTPDNRIFIYRDGLPIDTVRAIDYGTQPDFATETGDPVENLLKNPGFEGEFETFYDNHVAEKIEGWDVLIGDRYNSQQFIKPQEINNEQDFNNHILSIERYKWADGWSAAEVGQVVDVAPNETYTLSALVRGGIKKEGDLLGKIKIEEVQDGTLGKSVDITSKNWETYSLDYTTSAECKQIRVFFYLERDKWGAEIAPLDIDNVKLTGKSRTYAPKIGFSNKSSVVKYFTYDLSGAYAPLAKPEINITVGK